MEMYDRKSEERYSLKNEDAIIIGDLSKIYNISKRTLRLYHEMGLLTPYHVDEKTGYRYYLPAQFPRLEMILQMKQAGLSLKQIKQMLDTQNLSLFEAILGEQLDALDKKIAECRMYKESLSRQLDGCKLMQNPPVLHSIFVEYISRRTAFICRDFESYDMAQKYTDRMPWQEALDRVKSIFVQQGVPLTLFQQVGGIVSEADLKREQLICSGAFIELDGHHQYQLPLTSIEPGIYVCMYYKYTAMNNEDEVKGIRKLLDYIHQNEYQIVGDYIAQVVAESSVFDYNDSKIIVKQQIPVKVKL